MGVLDNALSFGFLPWSTVGAHLDGAPAGAPAGVPVGALAGATAPAGSPAGP
jgi:hypothetical protein